MEKGSKVKLPVIVAKGVVIFPNMVTSLPVVKDKSLAALKAASSDYDNEVIILTQKDMRDIDASIDDVYNIGVVAKVKQTLTIPSSSTHIIIEGLSRVDISDIKDAGDMIMGEGEKIPQDSEVSYDEVTLAYIRIVIDSFSEYLKLSDMKLNIQDQLVTVTNINKPGQLSDIIASSIAIPFNDKQDLLQIFDELERLRKVYDKLNSEISILSLKKEIEKAVKKNVDKAQREYYLKEQLKVIHKELGDEKEGPKEIEKYRHRLNSSGASEKVKAVLEKEILKLEKMPASSPDGYVIRNYLDFVLEIPWKAKTKEYKDLNKAEEILDKDHYGLKKVKERIIEYLAVRMNTDETNSTILCLVGPPGVGKTSIAKSIAKALNRNYVRMSLGGVRDEAEIRGHRRTYIGAMPGRIIKAIKQAGTINPVLLLDEVDKLGVSHQGGPSSALLEVLDSEQNNTFRDNYIEVEYDLSKVLFICTANDVSKIPSPLRDRMEIVEIPGYTSYEKKNIAIQHLISKQYKENGLKKSQLKISEDAIDLIIDGYCREAGVRKLERTIGKLCRMAVKEILMGKKKSIKISQDNIEEYLGTPKYRKDNSIEEPMVGVVRGLAWTQVGGETLLVEVNTMKGSGKLELTGNMGDVMKESAKVAFSYIRSKADLLGINDEFYKKTDISLHIPEGAVPKDGPSAGITMTTAMVSALTDRQVRSDIAMTGEVTIRGRVLAIGGLNEKVLAAKRIGIRNIIVPEANNGDVKEMTDEIKDGMNFIFVKEMNQVLDNAFIGGI